MKIKRDSFHDMKVNKERNDEEEAKTKDQRIKVGSHNIREEEGRKGEDERSKSKKGVALRLAEGRERKKCNDERTK